MCNQSLAATVRGAIRQSDTLQLGAIPLLYPILDTLGLRDTVNELCPSEANLDVGRVVLLLVLNRLMSPQPLCWVDRWAAHTVLGVALDIPPAKLYDNRLGRALDTVYAHLGDIWTRLVVRAIQVWQLDLSILHWDITSFYFQGAYTDSELIRYGHSRDHQSDAQQINLQADVTHQTRIPVGYAVLPGNTADITRPLGHLDALLRFLARPELAPLHLHPILVSDCKMITPEAVGACHQHGLFYLGPWVRDTQVLRVLRSVSDDELAEHVLAYRPRRQAQAADFVPYRGVWRPFRVKVPPPPEQPKAKPTVFIDRVLVVWSAGKARLDVQKRRTYLKRLLDGLENIRRQLNQGRYAQRDYVVERLASVRRGNPAKPLVTVDLQGPDQALHFKFHLDRDRLAAAQALDGRYALGTNAAHLSANDALTIFKAQDDAEKQFRTWKGPLAVRPVFLHTDERIEGLVFITLVALLVRALLRLNCQRAGVKLSVDHVLAEFAPWSAVDLTLSDGSHVRQVATPNDVQALVMTAVGVSAYERYLTALSSQG
jgi:transposase